MIVLELRLGGVILASPLAGERVALLTTNQPARP